MNDKQFVIAGLLGGISIGLAALAFPSATLTVREFTEGLIGIEAEPSPLRANLAAPSLNRGLEVGELEELFQGMMSFLNGRYAAAVPILGKYAMLGDKSAQYTIGTMFYFGRGFPVDREEAIRWFRLAAAQGGQPERETLAAAAHGTLNWDSTEAGQRFGYSGGERPAKQYDPGNPTRTYDGAAQGVGGTYVPGGPVSDSAPMGARKSIDEAHGSGSASRGYADGPVAVPQVDSASPVILNRAGPRTYSDDKGDIYTQAGPHGVINTRTGEFSPTN